MDRQRKEIQKKLEKTRTQLEQEKKDYQETQATYLSELEAISGEKSHLRSEVKFWREIVLCALVEGQLCNNLFYFVKKFVVTRIHIVHLQLCMEKI